MATTLTLGLALSCSIVLLWCVNRVRRASGLPPGPPVIPFLGNAHMLGDAKTMPKQLSLWARAYGDVFSLKLGSTDVIVLTSATAIRQIIDRPGWVGNSRPTHLTAGLCGMGPDSSLLFLSDCDLLRDTRRTMGRFFSTQNSMGFLPAQSAESVLLLRDLMLRPENFSHSVRRHTHSVAKIIAYGKRVKRSNDEEMQTFHSSAHDLLQALAPGRYPILEMFPCLKHVPAFLAPWKRDGEEISRLRARLHTQLFDSARLQVAAGNEHVMNSYIGQSIYAGETTHFDSYMGISMLDAGSDTTAAFILSFILVLCVFPSMQSRVRQEIDDVIGLRLPALEDLAQLPYLDALIKETLRYKPQFPIGVPHRIAEDASYNGFRIPKNATVILNTYGLFRDPTLFEAPEVFNPERFLESKQGTIPGSETDFRMSLQFGAGRRVCPGQWIAWQAMQLAAMRLVWAFSFSDAKDQVTQKPMPQDLDCYDAGFIVHPHPFTCTIQLRSPDHQQLISQSVDSAEDFLSRYDTAAT